MSINYEEAVARLKEYFATVTPEQLDADLERAGVSRQNQYSTSYIRRGLAAVEPFDTVDLYLYSELRIMLSSNSISTSGKEAQRISYEAIDSVSAIPNYALAA